LWEFPGGSVELANPGPIVDSAKCAEEFGITISVGSFLDVVDPFAGGKTALGHQPLSVHHIRRAGHSGTRQMR
jgi:8-oxo-dGTP pyrophosphatase MutT (NUDIX family)